MYRPSSLVTDDAKAAEAPACMNLSYKIPRVLAGWSHAGVCSINNRSHATFFPTKTKVSKLSYEP